MQSPPVKKKALLGSGKKWCYQVRLSPKKRFNLDLFGLLVHTHLGKNCNIKVSVSFCTLKVYLNKSKTERFSFNDIFKSAVKWDF